MWMFQISKAQWFLVNLIAQCSCNLHQGFSRLKHGHRLDGSVINSFPEFSFLDCVTECLVTPRCTSVNYFKGANFCELNYERKQTAYIKFTESPGWVNSEKDHWPKVYTLSFFYFFLLYFVENYTVRFLLLTKRKFISNNCTLKRRLFLKPHHNKKYYDFF